MGVPVDYKEAKRERARLIRWDNLRARLVKLEAAIEVVSEMSGGAYSPLVGRIEVRRHEAIRAMEDL